MKIDLIQKTYDALLIIFFCSVISIPLVNSMVTEEKKWSEAEKRVLEAFPSSPETVSDVFTFPGKFEKYYDDHFGFRELMIYRYHREMENRFGVTGTPLVLKGQGKWLYYTGNEMLKDFRGELTLSRQDLLEWRKEQLRRYKWLAKKGVHYLSFSPPNKHTIYPEFLPEEYLRVKGVTRIEQLHEYLVKNPLPFYVDVYHIIKKSKPIRKLYYQTDTHWNHYGAYVCYKEVIKRVQQLFPQQDFVEDFLFHRNYRLAPGGDLARMLMIDRKVSERNPKMRYRESCSHEVEIDFPLTDVSDNKGEQPLFKKCSKATLSAIVFSDSFIDNLEPFLSENFGQILYLRKDYDQRNIEELLESFQPDIVIEEKVERNYFP